MYKNMMEYSDLEFSQKEKDFVEHGSTHYLNELTKHNLTGNEATLELLHIIDSINEENLPSLGMPVSCKKGCAYCCHIKVAATEDEAKLVVDYCEDNNIEITPEHRKRLFAQSKLDSEVDYMMSKDKKCVFLGEDNCCKVYEVRPSACRNYFVFSDPSDCDGDNPNKSGKVLTNFDLNTLVPIVTLFKRSKLGNFSENILKQLNNK